MLPLSPVVAALDAFVEDACRLVGAAGLNLLEVREVVPTPRTVGCVHIHTHTHMTRALLVSKHNARQTRAGTSSSMLARLAGATASATVSSREAHSYTRGCGVLPSVLATCFHSSSVPSTSSTGFLWIGIIWVICRRVTSRKMTTQTQLQACSSELLHLPALLAQSRCGSQALLRPPPLYARPLSWVGLRLMPRKRAMCPPSCRCCRCRGTPDRSTAASCCLKSSPLQGKRKTAQGTVFATA